MGTYDALRTYSQQLDLSLRSLDKLSIAALNGYAIQTGLSLALCCDFRIASQKRSWAAGPGPWVTGRLADNWTFTGALLAAVAVGFLSTPLFIIAALRFKKDHERVIAQQ